MAGILVWFEEQQGISTWRKTYLGSAGRVTGQHLGQLRAEDGR